MPPSSATLQRDQHRTTLNAAAFADELLYTGV
jgi:hypothetical protein